MYRVFCLILSVYMSIFSFFGIDLIKQERQKSVDIEATSVASASDKSFIFLEFSKQFVNTAEITFEKEEEATVSIYNENQLIYKREGREKYRFCAFNKVETDSLQFKFEGAYPKDIKLSFKTADNSDFRVTTYITASTIQNKENLNPDHFDVITDVILFGVVAFNEQGKLSVDKNSLEKALSNLHDVIGDRKVNIYINILGPDGDSNIDDWNKQMYNKAAKHTKAFMNPDLRKEIKKLHDEYRFDGVFFDYEYPLRITDWIAFNSFLRLLKLQKVGKIGLAVADWNIKSAENLNSVADMIELMQYDLFDKNGEHSSFTTCVDGLKEVDTALIKRSKVDMGVPFYGRPDNAGGYWPEYKEYAELLNGNDGCKTKFGYSYFNCSQTIYDKTAYCLSRGLGGMMIWHYSCDVSDMNSEYSLFGAMKQCLDDRSI